MRHVRKQGNGPYALRTAHSNPPKTSDEATTRWGGLRDKDRLRNEYLLEEQFHLCCYSEVRADELGIGFHIEHVHNKRQAPDKTFDYTNLAASAFDSDVGLALAARQDWEVFGGHAVGKRGVHEPVDMGRFVSPHRPDCHRFFAYLSNGEVVPRDGLTDDEAKSADYTIQLLNLNSPFLVGLRQSWWDELDERWQEHVDRDWSVPHLVETELLPVAGRMEAFFSLTRQFYGAAAEAVLLAKAPQVA